MSVAFPREQSFTLLALSLSQEPFPACNRLAIGTSAPSSAPLHSFASTYSKNTNIFHQHRLFYFSTYFSTASTPLLVLPSHSTLLLLLLFCFFSFSNLLSYKFFSSFNQPSAPPLSAPAPSPPFLCIYFFTYFFSSCLFSKSLLLLFFLSFLPIFLLLYALPPVTSTSSFSYCFFLKLSITVPYISLYLLFFITVTGYQQDLSALGTYMQQFDDSMFLEAVSDFNLLIFLALCDVLPMKEHMGPLLSAVRTQNKEDAAAWAQSEQWSTMTHLLQASG